MLCRASNLLLFLSFIWVTGCVGPAPMEDYVLAHAAKEAAAKKGAASFSPGYWHKSEEYYRKAVEQYEGRYYGEALELFRKARLYAERAENATRIKKFQSGEDF